MVAKGRDPTPEEVKLGEESVALFQILLFVLGIPAAIGFGAGYWVGDSAVRSEAVAVDAAHYDLDPKTGGARFVWANPPNTATNREKKKED